MTYRIEENKIIFDEPPAEGKQITVNVSTRQSVQGFADPNSYYPRRVNEPDTNRLSVNDLTRQHPVVNYKRSRVDDLTGEPKTQYNAKYPYNHVKETESGHIKEYDDTPGFERIHEWHRTGTFYEVHPDGSKVTKVVGEDYEIVLQNKKLRVRGNMQVFVDGDADLYVRGSVNGQVDEDMTWNVGRNITFHAGQNIRMYSNQSTEITAQQQITATAVGNMKLQTQADYTCSVDGDFKTNIKGNTDIIGDGYGVYMFGDDINFITDTHMDINAGTTMNVTSNGAMDLVGSTIDFNKAGRAAAAAISAPDMEFFDSRGVATYDEGEVVGAPVEAEVLSPKARTETADTNAFHGDDDVELSVEQIEERLRAGDFQPTNFQDYSYNAIEGKINYQQAMRAIRATPRISPETTDHGGANEGAVITPEAGNRTVTRPEEIEMTNGIDYNRMISRHFNVGDVSKNAYFGHNIRAQHGLTVDQIINNLSTVATNALDLIKDQYPNMKINSGFRPASGTSQHERGQAIDISFSGIPRRDYLEIAQWVIENVPYDQFLLEYANGAWLHLSLKPDGNRFSYATFNHHSPYGEWGRLYRL
jgi:hypothetical protein